VCRLRAVAAISDGGFAATRRKAWLHRCSDIEGLAVSRDLGAMLITLNDEIDVR